MIKQPDCRVVVFNIDEREGSNYPSSPMAAAVPILFSEIEITDFVTSVQTNKTKSSPSGTYNITLAPNRNWVAEIGVGSWIAIFMDSKTIPDESVKQQWNEDSLKLIGRIDTVRATRQVDQATGAWNTSYTIAGRDWACALEALVYIDQMAAKSPAITSLAPGNAGLGQFMRLKFDGEVVELYGKNLPSSSDVTDAFLEIWGEQGSAFNITANLGDVDAERFMPFAPFCLPPKIPIYMGNFSAMNKLAGLIERRYGILDSSGEYKRNIEAAGIFDLRLILGINSIWQVLNNVATVGGINEIYADLAFKDGKPTLALYKRVRPFALKNSLMVSTSHAADITSSFFNLPKTYIDPQNIILADVGGNWSDVVNFIEIIPDTSLFTTLKIPQAVYKGENAIYSVKSYTVSGFKPIRMSVSMFPLTRSKAPDITGLKDWLDVLKEWYFDTHKMLNGSLVISGQSGYISVGDNILFPASVVANGSFVSTSGIPSFNSDAGEPHILAHVETVSYSFTKQPDGQSNFTTTIQFVRGIITDPDGGKKLASGTSGYGVDSETPSDPRSNTNTLVTK